MLKDQNPNDSMDDIIDLTEIVQKGKPPRSISKEVVDFDSALSDLMGKVPEDKTQQNPELEELLSGIDEAAHERRGREARENDDMDDSGAGEDTFSQVDGADDMDSLLSSIDEPHKPVSPTRKAQQPVEDVDSLLDSLMDDIDPPASGAGRPAPQEISEADLDDLLDTIEQESTGKAPMPQEAPQDVPQGVRQEAQKEVPMDSLDDLLASLDDLPKEVKAPAEAPVGAAPARSLEAEAPLGNLEDLFNEVAAPPQSQPPLAPPVAPTPPASLDELLGDLLPKPVPKPIPSEPAQNKNLDTLDDILGDILPAAAGSATESKEPSTSLDDLLGDLVPNAPRASLDAKPPVVPQLAAALDNLGELLAELPPKSAAGKIDPVEAAKPSPAAVDGDESSILDSFMEVGGIESLEEINGILDGLDDPAPEPGTLPDDPSSSENFGDLADMLASGTPAEGDDDDDDVVCADGTSFSAEDMADMDSMFGSPGRAEESLPESLAAAMPARPRRAEAAAQPAEDVKSASSEPEAAAGIEPVDAPVSDPAFPPDPFAVASKMPAEAEGGATESAEPATAQMSFDPVFIPLAERPQPTPGPAGPAAMAPVPSGGMLSPLSPLPPQPASLDAQELQRRVALLESELYALQARVHTLEAANAMEMRQEQVSAMLVDGSPLSNRLTALMRMAISQEINALNDQGERHADSVAELESRTEALEAALAATEANSVPEPRVAELESRTEAVESGLGRVDILESRTNALETTLTQVAAQAGAAVAAPSDPALRTDLGSLESRVVSLEETAQGITDPQEGLQQLGERLTTLETRPYVPIETIQEAFDQMGAQLNKPLQQFQNRITTLESRLGDELPLLAGELVPLMTEHIERAAAESAARALREELAALLSDADTDEDADPQI